MYRPLFHDRGDAGRRLASRLTSLRGQQDVIVLALPRGGVPVGYEVAKSLGAPMDVFIVRKLGVPGHEEVAMGAIASGGVRVLNPSVIRELGITAAQIDHVDAHERRELARREAQYRAGRPFPNLKGATAVLVDDGIATGATMAAAIAAVRQQGAGRVVVAAPVIARGALQILARISDRCECVAAPEPFGGVGVWYEDFDQSSDEEVRQLIALSALQPPSPDLMPPASIREVRIAAGNTTMVGELVLPAMPHGIVVFAHGSGSSRFSPRNQAVARALNEGGYATLLFDLLTQREEEYDRVSGALRFDIGFLAKRLVAATDWLLQQPDVAELPVGYFGASTGAAAALLAASARPSRIRAVVSRGGRPDLAGDALPRVKAPTLLIVGGNDPQVLALNQGARLHLTGTTAELTVVPRAGHLFEEPGALDQVSREAGAWFDTHLAQQPVATIP